jgi:hypothetical protein
MKEFLFVLILIFFGFTAHAAWEVIVTERAATHAMQVADELEARYEAALLEPPQPPEIDAEESYKEEYEAEISGST